MIYFNENNNDSVYNQFFNYNYDSNADTQKKMFWKPVGVSTGDFGEENHTDYILTYTLKHFFPDVFKDDIFVVKNKLYITL